MRPFSLMWQRARARGVRRLRRGISIFEVLVAFIVLQTGMLVSVQMLLTGMQFGTRARRATAATLAAQARLEYVLREVVPTLTPAQVAAGTIEVVGTDVPSGMLAEADIPITWRGGVHSTGTAGLYDVSVEVHFLGRAGRPETATLFTRVFSPPGATP